MSLDERAAAEWEVESVAAFLHREVIGCQYVPVDAYGVPNGVGMHVSSTCQGDHVTEAMALIAQFTPATVASQPSVVLALLDVAEAARRYHDAEWAIRLHESAIRDDAHNARVDEWRAAEPALRAALDRLERP